MSIKIEDDIKELKGILKPHKLDFSALELESIKAQRTQHSVKYLVEKMQLDEEIVLGRNLLDDLEDLDETAREDAAKWLETGAKDDSLRPKNLPGQEAVKLMSALKGKHVEVQRVSLICEFHLKMIKRYDGIIIQAKKNGLSESKLKRFWEVLTS